MTDREHTTNKGPKCAVVVPNQTEQEEFERFPLALRLQHMAMFVSVIILIITGLPLKFADAGISRHFFNLVGGIMVAGIIHRIGAVILIGMGLFHMGYITMTAAGRREFMQLLPKFKDFTDVGANLLHFFGFSKTGACFGRFSYPEKFDYWAVYWGMVVMILSGLMLWFHNFIMSILPKVALDIAREAHSDEALLATLAIVIWHFYNVHFNPHKFPGSLTWFHGKISKEEMLRDHPLEYQEIMAAQAKLVVEVEEPEMEADEPVEEAQSTIVEGLRETELPTETDEEDE